MRQSIARFIAFTIACFSAQVLAGPAEDVAQIAAPRLQAFEDGNLDAWMAAYADSAVLQAFMFPFRVDGKEAIRGHFAHLFKTYPVRGGFVRHPVTRVYNDDLVIQNSYLLLNWTDQRGQMLEIPIRQSTVWAKLGGRWQIVDQHVSRLP